MRALRRKRARSGATIRALSASSWSRCSRPAPHFDGPDNITASPHGYALACTDGEDDQWLVGIDESGLTFPFAFNALNGSRVRGRHGFAGRRAALRQHAGPAGSDICDLGPLVRSS